MNTENVFALTGMGQLFPARREWAGGTNCATVQARWVARCGRQDGSRPHRVLTSQKEQHMTETPQQPTTALTEDEQKTVRSAALRAGALVAHAEPGFLDTFKESFAASKAVKGASPEVQKLVTGGLPEMPSGDKDEVNARTLELLKQAVGILREKAPQLVEEYRQVVLQSAKDVAVAADDTSAKETAAVGEIERALAD